MIFDPKGNFNVRNVFKQNWESGSVKYINEPRPRHGIVLVLNGRVKFRTKNNELAASRGDMILLPKNAFYETVIDSQAMDFLINFENEDIKLTEPTKLLSDSGGKYINIFNKIIDLKIKGAESDFLIKSQFYALVDNIVKDMDGINQKDKYFLEKAKEMLEDNVNYSIGEIAQKCGISQSGFRSVFKKTYGISPIDYKINVRINKAKFLLQSTDMSVEEIADKLNFYDTAYFCKVFKKNTGCSPKGYVKGKTL